MIIGRDLQFALGLDIVWAKKNILWDGLTCPLKISLSVARAMKQVEFFKQFEEIEQESYTSCSFVESTYEKADINKEVSVLTHLNTHQKQLLKTLLNNNDQLFDGTLGNWAIDPAKLELKESTKPYQGKLIPVPHVHKEILKKEVNRLLNLNILKRGKRL